MGQEDEVLRRYGDMIARPYPERDGRQRMTMSGRAAQFAPFAALSGYDAAIREAARRTEEPAELDECRKVELNRRLRIVLNRQNERPEITVTYFVPDKKKMGGAYVRCSGRVKRWDALRAELVMTDGTAIPAERIYGVEGAVFDPFDATAIESG